MSLPGDTVRAEVARRQGNRVVRHRVPVVFVPGIMGTRLRFPADDVTWDPDSDFDMVRWASRGTATKREYLDSARPGAVLQEPSDAFDRDHEARVLRGFGGVRWASYGTFLDFLEGLRPGRHHTPVYAYGYDWRQPVIQLGVQLAADVLGEAVAWEGNRATPDPGRFGGAGILPRERAQRVLLLTHSMGGLVTRAALRAAPALAEKVLGVLHGVQPATGAPTMYRRMITGMFDPVDGGGFADRVLHSILGSTGTNFAMVASVIPGAMQLLPSELYRRDAERQGVSALTWGAFDEGHATLHRVAEPLLRAAARAPEEGPPGFLDAGLGAGIHEAIRTRLSGVGRLHDFLERWTLDGKTWAFLGTNVPSDSTVHFDLPPPPARVERERRLLRADRYHAQRRDGTTVELDRTRDLVRNGYRQRPTGTEGEDRPWGHGPFGDGTVAAISGGALFPPAGTTVLPARGTPDFDAFSQFEVPDLEHEPAYRDARIRRLCEAWLRFRLGTLP